ncbi:glycosyl hydrolase family 17 protein [Gracilimonas tropica]|uniref:glycosyl hydrolase family 17 protein n=1 Tax=Gracilimonas tropica TaxID=454600 RepID=UPI000365AE13|nr:glycosyl hydrolase family 17 protein [Gracilimonas tropica]
MNSFSNIGIEPGRAICYSGYRKGQRPGHTIPCYEEVKEDLLLLEGYWKYLRLYNCDDHSQTVLDVIEKENLDFKVMLGAYIEAEMNNFNCPWGGGVYSEEELELNASQNKEKIQKLAGFADKYSDVIFSLSVGNEACVDWTDHYVHEDKVLEYVNMLKSTAVQPVTFCENYVPWLHKLEILAEALDFICVHTYPVWEYKHINEAIDYTKENYYSVAEKYPDSPVVIAEAGWATKSNGNGINPAHVSESYQKIYFEHLMKWTDEEGILTFFFEAFDEDWKGSSEPLEPEKHWGLFYIDRTPKMAIRSMYSKKLVGTSTDKKEHILS